MACTGQDAAFVNETLLSSIGNGPTDAALNPLRHRNF
jgi:hypothetical protein